MSLRKIFILSLFDLKHATFKMKGLLFLLPFTLYWLSMFYLINKGGVEFITSQEGFIASSFILSPELSNLLFRENPAVISMCFLLALTTIPFFVVLASHNQLASDAGEGSLRYLLTRCSRTELFIARFLSACYIVIIAYSIMLAYTTYLSLNIDHFPLADTFSYALQIAVSLFIYALPIIAFMSIFSAYFSSSRAALLLGIVSFYLLMVIRYWYRTDLSQLDYLLPNIFKNDLLVVNNPSLGSVFFYLIIYTLVYGCIGCFIFHRRNL